MDDKEGDLSPALLYLSLRETEMSRDVSLLRHSLLYRTDSGSVIGTAMGLDNCQLNFRYTVGC